MTEDNIGRMYQLVALHPGAESVREFERDCTRDLSLHQSWHDFLAEQYLSGSLSDAWKEYLQKIPDFTKQLSFQQDIRQGIRTLQRNAVRTEIQRILPKRKIDGLASGRRGSRFYTIAVSVAAIGLLGIGFLLDKYFWVGSALPKQDGIAVLMVEPFEMKGVTEEMVVHGISQQLPMKLSSTEGIYPVTHFAVGHATERVPMNQVAKTLGAAYKVRGKIQRRGDALHIEACLVNVEKNRALWKELFKIDADPKAFDDLQDQMSLKIANALHVHVSSQAHARLSREVSHNTDAINLFLAGERAWSKRTEESLRESISLFRMALQRDSASTIIRGYLALANETYAENDYGGIEYWNQAVEEANKTLKMDPLNPEALVVLGYYAYSRQKDYQSAAAYFTQALAVKPGDAKIHQAIAELHLRTGEIAIGKEHIQIARTIEPEHRVVRWVETRYLTASGLLEEARMAAEDLMEMYPDYANIRIFYWQYYLTKKEYSRALAAIPADRSEPAKKYFSSMVYLEQHDYAAVDALYPVDGQIERPESITLLGHVQKDEWDKAYTLLRDLLSREYLNLLAWFQVADFQMFNKMKQDPGILQILAEHGVKVNMIPKEVQPAI